MKRRAFIKAVAGGAVAGAVATAAALAKPRTRLRPPVDIIEFATDPDWLGLELTPGQKAALRARGGSRGVHLGVMWRVINRDQFGNEMFV